MSPEYQHEAIRIEVLINKMALEEVNLWIDLPKIKGL